VVSRGSYGGKWVMPVCGLPPEKWSSPWSSLTGQDHQDHLDHMLTLLRIQDAGNALNTCRRVVLHLIGVF